MGNVDDERIIFPDEKLKEKRDKNTRSSSTDGTRSRKKSTPEDSSNDKIRRASSTDGMRRRSERESVSPTKTRKSVTKTKGNVEEGARNTKDDLRRKSPTKSRTKNDLERPTDHEKVHAKFDENHEALPHRQRSRSISNEKEVSSGHKNRSPSRRSRRITKLEISPPSAADESNKKTGSKSKPSRKSHDRQELFLDPEVAQFIQMLESVSLEKDVEITIGVPSKSDNHKTDDHKMSKKPKDGNEIAKHSNGDHKTKDSSDSGKKNKCQTKLKNDKSTMNGMEDEDEDESEASIHYLDLISSKPHQTNSERGRSADLKAAGERERRSQSLRPSKKANDEEKSHHRTSIDKFLKSDKSNNPNQSTEHSDAMSVRSKRSSIVAWREQNKGDKSSKRNLLRQDKKDLNGDPEHNASLDGKNKEEEKKKILNAYRSGSVPVSGFTKPSAVDGQNSRVFMSNEMEDYSDASEENYGYEDLPNHGYLPTVLGRKQSNGLRDDDDEEQEVARRRPSFVSACDFHDLAEVDPADNSSSSLLNPSNKKSSKKSSLDSSQSNFNASISSYKKLHNPSKVKDKSSLSSSVSSLPAHGLSSTNRKSQSMDGDALDSIMKSRRLRGDAVQRASKPQAETKAKAKRFLFS